MHSFRFSSHLFILWTASLSYWLVLDDSFGQHLLNLGFIFLEVDIGGGVYIENLLFLFLKTGNFVILIL